MYASATRTADLPWHWGKYDLDDAPTRIRGMKALLKEEEGGRGAEEGR